MQRASFGLVVALSFTSVSISAQERKLTPLDLNTRTNQKLAANQGRGIEGNTLKELSPGEFVFMDIKFRVGDGLIQLGSKILDAFPDKVGEIPVGKLAAQLHFFHATAFGGGPNPPGSMGYVDDGTLIGEYTVRYEDSSSETIPIVYGEDVRDWFYLEGEKEPSKGKVAWRGSNDFAPQVQAKLRLYVSSWKNPKPDKKVVSIDYTSKKTETVAAPFCVAITVEEK
jgi:hypothetical protein